MKQTRISTPEKKKRQSSRAIGTHKCEYLKKQQQQNFILAFTKHDSALHINRQPANEFHLRLISNDSNLVLWSP